MKVSDLLRRSAVGIRPHQTVAEAAGIMDEAGVGILAVVDDEGALLGVVTDRDLVRRVMARGMPPDARVDSAMTTPAVAIDADEDVREAYRRFRAHEGRRLAVVRGRRFVGIISIDDMLIDLAGDLTDLARPISSELKTAQRDSPVPATT